MNRQAQTDPRQVRAGDTFVAAKHAGASHWTSTSIVTAAEAGRRFAFIVQGREYPVATWAFELTEPATQPTATAIISSVRLVQRFVDTVSRGIPPAVQYRLARRRLNHLACDIAVSLEHLHLDAAVAASQHPQRSSEPVGSADSALPEQQGRTR